MSVFHTPVLAGASGNQATYEIEQSLRFNSGDSTYLNWTPGSAGDRTLWTWSAWIKRSGLSSTVGLFGSYAAANNTDYLEILFASGNTLLVQGNNIAFLNTSQVFRDTSAWYHIVIAVDTSNATADDRIKIYVNGQQVTDFGTRNNPSSGGNLGVNQAGVHRLGRRPNGTDYFNGYMAEVNFIDGSALDQYDFGELDNNGVWRPIKYAGSYTGNSFYLKFASGDGTDSSGLSNTWTANNFTTSGTGTDVFSDTPTNNFCTFNPLIPGPSNFSEGNLSVTANSSSSANRGTPNPTFKMPSSGKYYAEFTPTTLGEIAVALTQEGNGDTVISYYRAGTISLEGSGTVGTGSSYTTGDVISVAVDVDNTTVRFYKNGAAQLSSATDYSSAPDSDNCYLTFKQGSSSGSCTATANYGQREFLYPPGTYTASAYFNTVTWTGDNNDDRSITVGFQPDLVWYKRRNLSASYLVFDSVRGATKALSSNNTTTENTEANALQAFETNGFQVGSDANSNSSSYNYVAWCWKAGGTASSNTDGSITASVSASDAAGFSVVKFEGNNTANASVGHGLSTAPSFIITKNIDNSSAYWATYIASAGKSKKFYINDNQAPDAAANWLDVSDSTITWNQTNVNNVNTNNNTFICYCWAEKTGVSKFGSYTGNGSTDGPLISDLGFAPALVVIKKDSSASEWAVYDSARGDNNQLRWDAPDQDNTNSAVNVRLTNTGFKIETSDSAQNGDGALYYYMAWARASSADENFKSLNTANLPAPEIKDGSDYFNTVLWTGNATARDITTGHNSNFTWIKHRNAAENHNLYDILRGTGNRLESNQSSTETNYTDRLTAFNSDGFSLGTGYNNTTSTTYVGWSWAGGGSGSSNTDGSITSTVSVNATAGFSIVTYTGTGAGATVGHGLGVAPSLLLFKNRDSAENWAVWNSALDATIGEHLGLNQQNGVTTNSVIFNSTAPTSTVFSVGNNGRTGLLNDDYVCYAFAEVEGYSKFGSYTGNNSTNGPFVYTGFKPAWLMVKKDANSTDWKIYDAGREPYNVVANRIAANTVNQELDGNAQEIDFVSNGFKFRGTNGDQNSAGTFYYVAFASSPFGGSGVSPATAR